MVLASLFIYENWGFSTNMCSVYVMFEIKVNWLTKIECICEKYMKAPLQMCKSGEKDDSSLWMYVTALKIIGSNGFGYKWKYLAVFHGENMHMCGVDSLADCLLVAKHSNKKKIIVEPNNRTANAQCKSIKCIRTSRIHASTFVQLFKIDKTNCNSSNLQSMHIAHSHWHAKTVLYWQCHVIKIEI